jgi:hypothetical protein
VVHSPRTLADLNSLKDSTYQPLRAPAHYAKLKEFVTTSIPEDLDSEGGSPTVANTSFSVVGDFREAVWGVRLDPTIVISRVAGDQTNGALRAYQVWIRIVGRVDV